MKVDLNFRALKIKTKTIVVNAFFMVLFGYYGSTIYERLDLYTNSAGFYNLFLFALFGYYGSMIHYFWGHTVNTGTAMIWIHYFQRVPAGTLWK